MRRRKLKLDISLERHAELSRQMDAMFAIFDAAFMPDFGSKRIEDKALACHLAMCKLRAELTSALNMQHPRYPSWLYNTEGKRFQSTLTNGVEVLNHTWAMPIVKSMASHRDFWKAVEFYAEYDQPSSGDSHA